MRLIKAEEMLLIASADCKSWGRLGRMPSETMVEASRRIRECLLEILEFGE
jgi:hypothetical protein